MLVHGISQAGTEAADVQWHLIYVSLMFMLHNVTCFGFMSVYTVVFVAVSAIDI